MTSDFSRRDFLRWASLGAGASTVGGAFWLAGRSSKEGALVPRLGSTDTVLSRRGSDTAAAPVPATASGSIAANDDLGRRALVVIELGGGNDGLSTLVPYGIGSYYDLRPSTAVAAEDLVAIDDEVGMRSAFAPVLERGLAVVQGVGSFQPDGSHFEMMHRWWTGDPDGSGSYQTGFLGRLADAIGDPGAPGVAMSIGAGPTPALVSAKVATLSLPSADSAGYLVGASTDDVVRYSFQRGLGAFGAGGGEGAIGRIRGTIGQTIEFAAQLASLGDDDAETEDAIEYPGSTLGDGLKMAARLLAADYGTRIVHVPMRSDFDTHEDHVSRHASLMDELAAALDAFHRDLDRLGISDRVLVMTTSEFGRRAGDNGSGGLDHGTASVALVTGPVTPGRYGQPPSLTELDENDNLVATVGFDSYYGSIAEGWFGVPAGDLFDTTPERLDLFG